MYEVNLKGIKLIKIMQLSYIGFVTLSTEFLKKTIHSIS